MRQSRSGMMFEQMKVWYHEGWDCRQFSSNPWMIVIAKHRVKPAEQLLSQNLT